MISSSPRFDPTAQAKLVMPSESIQPAKATAKPDRLSMAGIEALRAALQVQPEVRPEVVERGRALAADPSYPSAEIMLNISRRIIQSPDPAVDAND